MCSLGSELRPFDVPEQLFPYTSTWLEIDGVPVHVVDEGTGPVLLLLHGNFMWSFSYRHLIRELSSTFRCIAIDLPGMGMSGKPHELGKDLSWYSLEGQSRSVERIIDAMQLDKITLFAHDHGGPVGFGVAARRPELFDKLFITNSWSWSNEQYVATRRWSTWAPRFPTLIHKLLLRNRKAWVFESGRELRIPGVWEACTAPYRRTSDMAPVLALARELTAAPKYFEQINASLAQLSEKPTEIVWACRGGGMFPEFVEEEYFLTRWQSLFPDASTTLMKDVGYYFLSQPPQVLLDRLTSFAK